MTPIDQGTHRLPVFALGVEPRMTSMVQGRHRERIYALVVGVEQYDFPDGPKPLSGCGAACRRFRDWLVSNRIEPANIFLHLSPSEEGGKGAEFNPVGTSINRIAEAGADLVFVYWAGHGYAGGKRRNVLLADSYRVGFGYDVDALIGRIIRNGNVKAIVGIFDCCANPVRATFQLPSADAPPHDQKAESYVWFACSLGEVATYDPAKGGFFSDELLSELETRALPLNFPELDAVLQQKFRDLKQKGQRPVRYHALTPQGVVRHDYGPSLIARAANQNLLLAWIVRVLSNYAGRYRAHVLHDREFNVKGLATVGPFGLDLEDLYVDPFLQPRPPLNVSPNPIAPPHSALTPRSIWDHLRQPRRVAVLGALGLSRTTSDRLRQRRRHIAVLGATGMGKTTVLRHIVHRLAGPWSARPVNLLPIFLLLPTIQDDLSREGAGDAPVPTLAEIVERSIGRVLPAPQGWFEHAFKHRRCLLLLDGLDEISERGTRERVMSWLEQELRRYPRTQSMITSRPSERDLLKQMTVLEMKAWTPGQIEKFVRQWFLIDAIEEAGHEGHDVRRRAAGAAVEFLAQLDAKPALAQLAVNPLLLTLLVTVAKYGESRPDRRANLSDRRVDLYHEIFRVFLETWPQSRNRPLALDAGSCKPLLQVLAWKRMQQADRPGLTLEDIRDAIEEPLRRVQPPMLVRQFLKMVHGAGILLEHDGEVYEFSHFSFCEYLAAGQAISTKQDDVLLGRVADPWWRQTLLFYAGIAPDASMLIERCLGDENPSVAELTLALECLEEAKVVDSALRVRVESVRDRWFDDPDPARQAKAAQLLLSMRIAGMERRGDAYLARSPIAAFEYQLFLDDDAANDVCRQPDHLPFGRRLVGRDPVVGVRASDASVFCDWLTRREGGSWYQFRLPRQGETDGIGHWTITSDGCTCLAPPGTEPLISPEQLRSRYHHDLARALEWYRPYTLLSATPDRERELMAQLDSLGLSVAGVTSFAARVAASSFDFNRKPTLGGAVRRALQHDLDMEAAWDPDLLQMYQDAEAEAIVGATDADLCPDLQLSAGALRGLDLGQAIENLRPLIPDHFWLRESMRAGSALELNAGRLGEEIDSALARACHVIDARKPLTLRAPEDPPELGAALRWHARLCTAMAAGLILHRPSPRATSDSKRLSAYRALYVALAIVEERAQGTSSPYEAITIVKEKREGGHHISLRGDNPSPRELTTAKRLISLDLGITSVPRVRISSRPPTASSLTFSRPI